MYYVHMHTHTLNDTGQAICSPDRSSLIIPVPVPVPVRILTSRICLVSAEMRCDHVSVCACVCLCVCARMNACKRVSVSVFVYACQVCYMRASGRTQRFEYGFECIRRSVIHVKSIVCIMRVFSSEQSHPISLRSTHTQIFKQPIFKQRHTTHLNTSY